MSAITYHNHHIIPRHAGGTDAPENIVRLTVPEHAEAHRLLYEEHGREEDELAWLCLSGYIGKEEIIWMKLSLAGKKNKGKNHPFYGKKHSPETLAKMRKPKSEETKLKMRKPKSPETCEKMRKAQMGNQNARKKIA